MAAAPEKERKVFKQGPLRKQGGSNGGWTLLGWKERWFVFASDGISYYKDEDAYKKSQKELGFLQYDENFAIRNHDEASEPYLRIEATTRSIVVKARDMKVKKEWLDTFKKVQKELTSVDDMLKSFSVKTPVATILDVVSDDDMEEKRERKSSDEDHTENEPPTNDEERKAKEEIKQLWGEDLHMDESKNKYNSKSLKEGYLLKLGGSVQNWKKRYFMLVHEAFEYYKKPWDKKPQGSIKFCDTMKIRVMNIPHTFCITPEPGKPKGRQYYVQARNDDNRDEWLQALAPFLKQSVIYPVGSKSAERVKEEEGQKQKMLLELLDLDSVSFVQQAKGKARKRQQEFISFCETIFSEENPLFYLEVERYKRTPDADRLDAANDVIQKYIVPGADFEIGCAPAVKKEIQMRMAADPPKLTPDMFDAAQKHVFGIMQQDILPKFLETDVGRAQQNNDDWEESKVDVASIEQLLEELVSSITVKKVDMPFRMAFLLNHPLFISSEKLLDRILGELMKAEKLGDVSVKVASQIHMCGLLTDWMKMLPNDFQGVLQTKLIKELGRLLDKHSGVKMTKVVSTDPKKEAMKRLVETLQEVVEVAERLKFVTLEPFKPTTEDATVKMEESKFTFAFDDDLASDALETESDILNRSDVAAYSPKTLAHAMTMVDFNNFLAIYPREFVNKEWSRKETCEYKSPNILRMVDIFNKRSYWVASEILNREDPVLRTKMIRIFIDTAHECMKLTNWYAVFALVNGLGLTPVHRLKADWARLSNASKMLFERLRDDVTSSAKNNRSYRKLLREGLGKPQIPHLAVTLKDCFQLEELPSKDEMTGKINFSKFMKQYSQLADVFQCQRLNYHLGDDPSLLNVCIVLDVAYSRLLSEKKLWSRSYRFEPKEKKQAAQTES